MPTPGLDSARQIVAAVKDGKISEAAVDECVDRLLEAVLTLTKERDIPAELTKKRTMRWLGKLRRKVQYF